MFRKRFSIVFESWIYLLMQLSCIYFFISLRCICFEKISHNTMEKNLRSTPLRTEILSILDSQATPMTVSEIQKILNTKGMSPNKTTVYRQMETLITNNMIQKFSLRDGVVHYEIQKLHHHHFVCRDCERITCIADRALEENIHKIEQNLMKDGFHIQKHNFSFEGKCRTCTT